MRYIDTSAIGVPGNWITLAQQQGFNPLWSYFKVDLESLVGKKCWYSESDNSGAKNPIDHFRPKANQVKKLTKKNADLDSSVWITLDCDIRSGYPFLEFEFSNYRYSCDFTNSLNRSTNGKAKGKSNFFPLRAGSAYGTDAITISTEEVCLLDPTVSTDPALLFFTALGLIEPNHSVLKGTWNYSKVLVSIELYHLHYFYFVEKRKETWNTCKDHIELIDPLYGRLTNTVEENKNLAHHILRLTKLINKRSEFSAVAIDCIKHFKKTGNYPWLDLHFPDTKLQK